MTNFCCSCRNNCTLYAALASLIIGVVTAFLRITAVITVGPAFLWVVLGVAIAYLGITLLKADSLRNCGCSSLNVLFTGILGSVLTSVILLAITFAATSVIGAIITGALLFFITLTLTSTVCLVKHIAGCDNN